MADNGSAEAFSAVLCSIAVIVRLAAPGATTGIFLFACGCIGGVISSFLVDVVMPYPLVEFSHIPCGIIEKFLMLPAVLFLVTVIGR